MPGDRETKVVPRAGGRRQVDDAFEDLLDTFTTHLDEVTYLSFRTQDTYAKWVRDYYRWLIVTEPALSLTDASPATIRSFVVFKRGQKVKPVTIGTILYSLTSFYEFLFLDDLTRANPAKGVKGPRIIAVPTDPLTEDEVRQMLNFAQHYERSGDQRRWVAYVILVIFASTGVRNAELRTLLTEKVNLARRELRVLGKGSKERIIPFGDGAAEALKVYAEELRPHLARSAYFIVNPASLEGHNVGRMGEGSLRALVKSLLAEAGIAGAMNPHRFRHSYATMVVRKSNMEVSRELLGHTDIKTTSHYANSQDRHDGADKVDLVPRSEVTEKAAPVGPWLPPTDTTEPLDDKGRSVELVPLQPPAPPLPVNDRSGIRADRLPIDENLGNRCHELLGEAVNVARRLPPRLLLHLNSERLIEAALGSCITTGLNTDVSLAAAGAVLNWAHDLPLPLDALLATYGPHVAAALTEVRTTLELLSGLDPSSP
jgi:integrase/recombinase XerC